MHDDMKAFVLMGTCYSTLHCICKGELSAELGTSYNSIQGRAFFVTGYVHGLHSTVKEGFPQYWGRVHRSCGGSSMKLRIFSVISLIYTEKGQGFLFAAK